MSEERSRLLDPRAPVIVTAKLSRSQADDMFAQKAMLQQMLLEASAFCAWLMNKHQVTTVELGPDDFNEAVRLARFMHRTQDGLTIKLQMVGQHEAQGDNGGQAPPEETKQ